MEQKNQIKMENRKALPKFFLVLLVALVVGVCTGYFSARYGLFALSETLKEAGAFFGQSVAPWLMVALAVVLPICGLTVYRRTKKMLDSWDGEDEAVSDAIDTKLSWLVWLSGAAMILAWFLLTATYSCSVTLFESDSVQLFFVDIGGFAAVLIEVVLMQQKSVDATKRLYPEKQGSVYDMKFQKKWLDSCDEAEKIMIGRCAFRAYRVTNTTCTVLCVVLALAALIFDIGFLPSLSVCLIWLISHTVYCLESVRCNKPGGVVL